MKTIRINRFHTNGKLYSVSLGNGYKEDFPSVKKVKRYLCEVNRYLTYKLHETNIVYCELFLKFRHNWFYLDHNRQSGKSVLFEMERRSIHLLEASGRLFDLMVKRSDFENGNHFVFVHFNRLFTNMKIIIADLQELNRKKSRAVDVYELKTLHERILKLESDINNYTGPDARNIAKDDELSTPQLSLAT